MRALIGLVGLVFLLNSSVTFAQATAPVPKKSPRTPVKSQTLANAGKKIPASRSLSGKATIINTQTLRVQGFKVRLFGIVPPHLGASYGPQARAVLDSLASGTTSCKILDRRRDGQYLSRCRNEMNQDYGLELLRRGLAVTARGSLKHTDIERNYIAAEQTAQSARLGLWSMNVPAAASSKSIRDQATKMVQAQIAKKKAEKEAKIKAEQAAADAAKAKATEAMMPVVEDIKPEAPAELTQPELPAPPSLTANEILAALSQPPLEQPANIAPATDASFSQGGLLERFQFMITGLILLTTALIVTFAFARHRWLSRREEVRSVAAAIRGELMASRSICRARLSKIEDEGTEEDIAWPRLRSLVFQAYVGRLGDLGAQLSRQIASIYGQSSDYASYYRTHSGRSNLASKKRALEALVHHIDEINPQLAQIEQSGTLNTTKPKAHYGHLKLGTTRSSNLSLPKSNPPIGPAQKSKSKVKNEAKPTQSPDDPIADILDKKPGPVAPAEKKEISAEMANHLSKAKEEFAAVKENAPEPEEEQSVLIQTATEDTAKNMINFAAPIFQKISTLKDKASTHRKKKRRTTNEFDIPDYANLSEEEIEELLYTEEEVLMAADIDKSQQTG